ncbi:uncharacterized protein LOC113217217 [Frankliniella occidentalis]|uniref:Uncharacterized protein LOC113217217 n=1 Tax=Frankliniella occidentalis TaxID=133901 RepID=A0A9C6XR53_FRAOC|nr:uncharacterized protein LOC113217217 [Frankliniella occidentalis]
MLQWLEVRHIYKPAQRYQSASTVSYKTINMALKLILLAVTLTVVAAVSTVDAAAARVSCFESHLNVPVK